MIYVDNPKFLHGSDVPDSRKPVQYWVNTMKIAKANADGRTRDEQVLILRNQYVLRSCK